MRLLVFIGLVDLAMAAVYQVLPKPLRTFQTPLIKIEPLMKKMLRQGAWKHFLEARRAF